MLESLGLDTALEGRELWTVWIHIKVGMDRGTAAVRVFENEGEADAFCNKYTVGMVLDSEESPWPINFEEVFENGFDQNNLLFSAGGDPNFGLIYDCLSFADVINERTYLISDEVLKWAGQQRIDWAKEAQPENWECLIELEYCTYHFPRSSLAFLAAQFQFNYYVLQDDYSAGYLMREIEVILGGAETVAEVAINARKSAGDAGRKASQSAKRNRLFMFLAEIEKLGDLVGRVSEKAILDQAFQNAIEQDQSLWRQGRGQQAEYETLLRSEPEYRVKYYQVFDQTA